MCKYCEKMEALVSQSYLDGEVLEATLVPMACGKDYSPGYIFISFDPLKHGLKGNGVYATQIQVSYCPKCGRKIDDESI